MATKNILIRGGADFSGMKREILKAQKMMANFQKRIKSIMQGIGVAIGGITIGNLIKDSTMLAMEVESAMGNIQWNMGNASKAFDDWVQKQSQALGIGIADMYRFGAVYSNLLGSFTKDFSETAKYTQELITATAIIASKTGRSFEDVAERIRSGLLGNTEAIEDLGVFVNISMIESTEAFRRFAGDRSWNQLDYQTQQQIRLAAILEQTYKRYGDTLANNTASRHAEFIASLQNIKYYLGQAFLPIYNTVLPALTSMANSIANVLRVIAQFFQALFGKSATKQTQAQVKNVTQQAQAVDNLGNAIQNTGKTAKKVRTGLAGFDEITNIKTTSEDGAGSSGAGAGAGTAIQPIPADDILDTSGVDESTKQISKKIQKFANKVKNFFAPIGRTAKKVWDEIAGYAGEKFKEIADFWAEHGGQFLQGMKNVRDGIKLRSFLLVGWYGFHQRHD